MKPRRARFPLRAVSLFTNCGAGDYGFAKAGFSFEAMAEIDARRLSIAALNHPDVAYVPGDLRETWPLVVAAYHERVGPEPPALLVACPPCQGMSSARSARGHVNDPDAGSRDPRNLLVVVIAETVRALQPRAVVIENVEAFLTRKVRHPMTGVAVSGANYLIETLGDEYISYPLLADLSDFGVPQSRRRSFLTFFRREEAANRILRQRGCVPYPWPSHSIEAAGPISLRVALDSYALPTLDAGDSTQATSEIPLHQVPVWSPSRYSMISHIPPNSGRSAWNNDSCVECGAKCERLSEVLCPRCGAILPRPVVNSGGSLRLIKGFRTSYRRMDPSRPAATITTASGHVGSDVTIHPWENRVLSPLECQLLQTIPPSFRWGDALRKWGHTNVRRMIGEAVPPLFTWKHGRILAKLLRGIPPEVALGSTDQRVARAIRALERARGMQTTASPPASTPTVMS